MAYPQTKQEAMQKLMSNPRFCNHERYQEEILITLDVNPPIQQRALTCLECGEIFAIAWQPPNDLGIIEIENNTP